MRGEGGEAWCSPANVFLLSNASPRKIPPTTALAEAELLNRYNTHGPSFIADLNGLFSGFLIDTRRRRVLLFNDRYGSERLYLAERAEQCTSRAKRKRFFEPFPNCVHRRRRRRTVSPLRKHVERAHAVPRHPRTSWRNAPEHRARHREEPPTLFRPRILGGADPLDEAEFESEFREAFLRALPGYFTSDVPIGISITGGLDTRMILACMPPSPELRSATRLAGRHTRRSMHESAPGSHMPRGLIIICCGSVWTSLQPSADT